jgi:hypothetical protein
MPSDSSSVRRGCISRAILDLTRFGIDTVNTHISGLFLQRVVPALRKYLSN